MERFIDGEGNLQEEVLLEEANYIELIGDNVFAHTEKNIYKYTKTEFIDFLNQYKDLYIRLIIMPSLLPKRRSSDDNELPF